MPTTALPKSKWQFAIPMILVAGVGVYSLLPMLASLSALQNIARTVQWKYVALALLAQAGSYWGYGLTISQSARAADDEMSSGAGMILALAASDIGLVAGGPIGYAAATYYWMRGLGHKRSAAVLCGWLPGAANAVVLVIFAILGGILFAEHHTSGVAANSAVVATSVGLAALIGVAVWIARDEGKVTAIFKKLSALRQRIRRNKTRKQTSSAVTLARTVHTLMTTSAWKRILAAAFTATAFDIVTLSALFLATHTVVTPGVLLAGYGAPLLAGRLPLTPDGIGIVEGGMVGLYVALGIASPHAVAIVLAYRVASLWIPAGAGLVCMLLLSQRVRRINRTHAPRGKVARE